MLSEGLGDVKASLTVGLERPVVTLGYTYPSNSQHCPGERLLSSHGAVELQSSESHRRFPILPHLAASSHKMLQIVIDAVIDVVVVVGLFAVYSG